MDPSFDGALEEQLARLKRYALALARDEGAADDLVQAALLKAIEGRASFQSSRPLRTWLLAILHNVFVSEHRRRAAERSRDTSFAQLRIGDGEPGQENAVYLRQIAARFAALPEDQRAALHLVAVEELSYQEAAEALSVPVGTIMSRLSRGRAALRKQEAEPGRAGTTLRIIGGSDGK